MKKLILISLFLATINSAIAINTTPEIIKNPFIDSKMKVVDPLSLSVDEPLILNTGVDIDMNNQLSSVALMPANRPEVTIAGRKGANYEVQAGDGFTWDLSVAGGQDARTMPLGGKDKFRISCEAKTFGENEDISKKLQQLTVIYDSKK